MRPSTTPALLLTVTLAAVGCGPDASTDPQLTTPKVGVAAAAHQAATQRPVNGSCEATSSDVTAFIPPVLHQVSTAECTISHLGRVSIRTVQQINTVTGVQVAEGTWTTANGDLLYATALGAATPTGPTTISFTGVTTIVGGTGRFANASGRLDVAGTANNATGAGSFTYDGWMTYDASDRRSR